MLVDSLIAKRHLMANKKQTLVAMLGVTFGIAMFILMISFMVGVNQFLEDTMLSSTPDIHIYNDIKTDYSVSIAGEYFGDKNSLVIVHHPKPKQVKLNIKDAAGIISNLLKDPDITYVSPFLSTQVFYNYGPVQINGSIEGVNIADEAKIFDLAGKMTSGTPENLLSSDKGIIMGRGLADKLNLSMGDMVKLTTPTGTTMSFRVVGLFAIGISTIDNTRSYVNLANVQQLMGEDRNYITDINIKLRSNKLARAKARDLAKKYNYKSDDWETANSSVMASNIVRDTLTYVVSFTLLVVAGFGIYNIMNMTINNKMKDIAILKAQGFAGKDIVQIFLSQSLFIGIFGAIMGEILGFMLSYALSRVPFPASDFIALKYFPVVFRPTHYFFGLMFGVITPLVAGLMPSLKASKVDPVAILRG
ncbi:ABC transporter permease [Mucilaginibacter ginsenosidivorans]|nr:ABC transporter permease [Mucilaginibacter ginsenosidivorans]